MIQAKGARFVPNSHTFGGFDCECYDDMKTKTKCQNVSWMLLFALFALMSSPLTEIIASAARTSYIWVNLSEWMKIVCTFVRTHVCMSLCKYGEMYAWRKCTASAFLDKKMRERKNQRKKEKKERKKERKRERERERERCQNFFDYTKACFVNKNIDAHIALVIISKIFSTILFLSSSSSTDDLQMKALRSDSSIE